METWVLQLVTAVLGALSFSLIFNVRGRLLIYTTFGGLLAWGCHLLLGRAGLSAVESYVIAGSVITIYAEICARVHRAPATVFIVTSFIPLIPGSSLYATMVYAVNFQWTAFFHQGLETLLLAGAISMGIILVSTVLHAAHAAMDRWGSQL